MSFVGIVRRQGWHCDSLVFCSDMRHQIFYNWYRHPKLIMNRIETVRSEFLHALFWASAAPNSRMQHLCVEPSLGFGLTIMDLVQEKRSNCRLPQLSPHFLHTHNFSELPPQENSFVSLFCLGKNKLYMLPTFPRHHTTTRLWFQCHSLRWNLTQDVQATESGESHEGTACCLRVKFHRDLERPKTVKGSPCFVPGYFNDF